MSVSVTLEDDRYHRQSLITWWDQAVLLGARVLVVGAGALGNELVKCLALTGVGHVTVVDMDRIENSNLSRCVLFRADDEGEFKAQVVARRGTALNPDVEVVARTGRVQEFGLGELAGFDLVIAGLDNREARVWVNQACRKLGLTWIDGAIEGLRGNVRVFFPDGPCYECTLGSVDRQILDRRKSCALLDVDDIAEGKVPTTATSASLIAALQVQEAVKYLHGHLDMMGLRNEGLSYVGESLEVFKVTYSEDEGCLAHDRYGELEVGRVALDGSLRDLALGCELDLGSIDAFDLESEIVVKARCHGCQRDLEVTGSTVALRASDIECPGCGELAALELRRSVAPEEALASLPVADLRLPSRDVVTIRSGHSRRHFVIEPAA